MARRTPFQNACEKRIEELLAVRGRSLIGKINEERIESYWHARISGTDFRVWVYEDEAQITGKELSYLYESEDFSSPESLIEKLVQDIVTLLDG